MKALNLSLISAFLLFVSPVRADGIPGDDEAFFDPPYPVSARLANPDDAAALRDGELRSDLLTMMKVQTPVKSQARRGTCSVFSATALLETTLLRTGAVEGEVDFSEEWLQYLVTRYASEDGSFAFKNLQTFVDSGFVDEVDAPYVSDPWAEPLTGLAEERCGHLSSTRLASCLIGHWDPKLLTSPWQSLVDSASDTYNPEFLELRKISAKNRAEFMDGNVEGRYAIDNIQNVRALLRAGTAVILELPVYYGAWNHRVATELGIGRDMANWHAGLVGYPEAASVDYAKSDEQAAGHSVLVVGYDDERIVETRVKMQDGTERAFRYRGAYVIKNSWGTSGFGKDFQAEGRTFPGYGVLTYRYAHQFGSFYRLPFAGLTE
ncbi:MAG: hypothetical protein IT285_08130 [Bdellovibrionales bacterium]|nr:hypothetical protein [Bdellovibrionales bacterium]